MPEGKDRWDKVGIILQPIGGLLTAMAIAALGLITSKTLNDQQEAETNTRLYTELMSRREESESLLRKDMFESIISSFVAPDKTGMATQVLNLELLAYNFHESLNLKPLFIDLKKRIESERRKSSDNETQTEYDDYLKRLQGVAREITRKQVTVLEGVGVKADMSINLEGEVEGMSLEPVTLVLDSVETTFEIDILSVDRLSHAVRIEMLIKFPDPLMVQRTKMATFTVSYFDFPMIDNTRLIHDQRCAVVLNNFTEISADITVVVFPGAYASLKEKPYYSEVIENVRKESKRLSK